MSFRGKEKYFKPSVNLKHLQNTERGLQQNPQTADMMGIRSQDLYPYHSQVPSNFVWTQCFYCSLCHCIALSQPLAERFWRPEETKEHLSHFPTFPPVDQWFRGGQKFLLKPKVVHLSKVTIQALSLCACWGTVPKKGQDNIACLKEVLQKTFNILGCTLLAGKLFSTSAEWYSLLTTISYLQI